MQNYLIKPVVFFPYVKETEVRIPMHVISRLKIFHDNGVLKVNKRNVDPIFFWNNTVVDNILLAEMRGDDDFDSCCKDFSVRIKNGFALWIFSPKDIIEYLCLKLNPIGPECFEFYTANDSDDTLRHCRIIRNNKNFDTIMRPFPEIIPLNFSRAS